MKKRPVHFLFDPNDYKLLAIVNDVLRPQDGPQTLSSLMAPSMHPHGIKEMAAPSGLRIAYAIARLLDSLEVGKANDRIGSLRCLRDEVSSSSTSFYHKNTARVLMQIMKELVRSKGNQLRQLQLAHDFRMVYTGKPRRVRTELATYHLLEMPEEWNQFAFDDHIHDANTKGRKSPTHLLMDAWIKGIRQLTVVYYNHVDEEVVEELLEAASILEMHVRIGIELSFPFRERFARFIWELDGFLDHHTLLRFLQEAPMRALMEQGREVSAYQQRYVFAVLDAFNKRHRPLLDAETGVRSESLSEAAFLRFVGAGQPSLVHLAKCIQDQYSTLFAAAMARIEENETLDAKTRQEALLHWLNKRDALSLDAINERFLAPEQNPSLPNPAIPSDDGSMPALLNHQAPDLLNRLAAMHSGSRFTLNLQGLSAQDTLELLYICKGRITHIEAFNLKDAGFAEERNQQLLRPVYAGDAPEQSEAARCLQRINTLQKALNEDNVIVLKRVIRLIIWDLERLLAIAQKKCESQGLQASAQAELKQLEERKQALLDILLDIGSFHGFYRNHTLRTRIGTGSTGQSQHQYGMGLVVLDTLPPRARRMVLRSGNGEVRRLIPVTAHMIKRQQSIRTNTAGRTSWYSSLLAFIPQLANRNLRQWQDWSLDSFDIHPGREGNIATLGGIRRPASLDAPPLLDQSATRVKRPFNYLNTNLANTLKIVAGFIPAFLTFSLTKDWWLLAYCGAFIWFGVTGVRNIIQSILGGGGLKRSPLLPWNSLVSWSRIADSLFFTGFSVPLLDYLVKTVLLQHGLGISTTTNPVALYSFMALANGVYISTHNMLRGLPRSAAVGNFFRSILSIPLAIAFNMGIASMLHAAMIPQVELELQKWAALISKLASDCVAAVIEGLADRQNNIRIRLSDYRDKVARLFSVFAQLDVLFPEEDVLEMLQSPKQVIRAIRTQASDLERMIIVNALDLMYLWMYQPRARKALLMTVREMSNEEWLIFYRSQLVLKRQKEISQVFVDGLVGKNFAKALSFYLAQSDRYLLDMVQIGKRREQLLKKEGRIQSA